jgi:RNA polymerase sigma factor (sigma-70 family)
MEQALSIESMAAEQDQRIVETVAREQHRLRNFIRKRVPDVTDAEDILQDVFAELVEAYRLTRPIGQVSAWLFRVARNRITDLFRKKKAEPFPERAAEDQDEADAPSIEDLLPSPDGGPEAAFARRVLLEALDAALDELPDEQREVFIAHEWEGRSFKELAAESGQNMNTLLWRKHSAVLHLRRRLRAIYEELSDL